MPDRIALLAPTPSHHRRSYRRVPRPPQSPSTSRSPGNAHFTAETLCQGAYRRTPWPCTQPIPPHCSGRGEPSTARLHPPTAVARRAVAQQPESGHLLQDIGIPAVPSYQSAPARGHPGPSGAQMSSTPFPCTNRAWRLPSSSRRDNRRAGPVPDTKRVRIGSPITRAKAILRGSGRPNQ